MKLLESFIASMLYCGVCLTDKIVGRGLSSIPKTTFSCNGKGNGYFADIEAGCQAYHLCDGGGRQYTYLCPNQTLFNQRMLICDHWYQVECRISADFYNKNSLIGKEGQNFLNEEENSHPGKRVSNGDSFPDHLAASRTVSSQIGSNRKPGPVDKPNTSTVKTTVEPVQTAVITSLGPARTTVKTSQERTTATTVLEPVKATVNTILEPAKTIKPTPAPVRSTTIDFWALKVVEALARAALTTEVPSIVETTTSAHETIELHTDSELLTTIVQEERISLIKLLSPNKTVPVAQKVVINNSATTKAPQNTVSPGIAKTRVTASIVDSPTESDESSVSPTSLFDTETLAPGTLEFELVSLARAHTNEEALTTLGFTDAHESAHGHEHDSAHGHAHDIVHGHAHDIVHGHAHDSAHTLDNEFVALLDMRRIFFIPADDHTMPPEENNVVNVQLNTIDESSSMKFKGKKFFQKFGRVLDPNPSCPHCHPHFLQPGQCIPCVIIR